MHFSKTAEYTIRVLLYLHLHQSQAHSVAFLHKELDLPYKYLTKLMTQLEKRGLLVSKKGRNGGFRLAMDAKEIYLSDILEAIDEPIDENRCILGFEMCDALNPCALHNKWVGPKKKIENMIQTTSLASLAKDNNTKM